MQDVSYPKGIKAWGLSCGIKKNNKPDLGVLVSEPPARVFGAFTSNAVKAAPVIYDQEIVSKRGLVSHVIVNSGNANACTGARGYQNVVETVALLTAAGKPKGGVMVSSTGVIGEYLPMEKIGDGIKRLFAGEAAHASPAPQAAFSPFIDAIMTTDTAEKKAQIALHLDGKEVRLGGVAKGAGMIRPDMATMLAYLTTDIELEPAYDGAFKSAVQRTFNSISVDGDMSTNDTVLLLANGASGVRYHSLSEAARAEFDLALIDLMEQLAKAIVRDGEGATKLVTVEVRGARSDADAKAICRAVANSPLVKTAFFGGDANWGRVLAAAGSAGVELDPAKLTLEFCGVRVMAAGGALAYDGPDLDERMKAKDVSVRLDLGLAQGAWAYWTCDFSYDYVKINAAYRT